MEFSLPGLISSTTFDWKLGFTTANHQKKKKKKIITDFDLKHLLRTENSQKSPLKTFYYNTKGIWKVKDFEKLSNKEIYFIIQCNSTEYNKSFKFTSFSFNLNFLEGQHILNPEIWCPWNFSDWFKKGSDGYIFSHPSIYEMGSTPNIWCPRCKKLFKCNLVSLLLLNWAQKKP